MGRSGTSGGAAGSAGQSRGPGRPKETVSTGGIDYVRSDRSTANGEVLVKVSTSRLNEAWERSGTGYIDRDGTGAIGDRAAGVREFLRSGKPVNAPQVVVQKDGSIVVRDGRHRVAVLRDAGKRNIVVSVSRSQAEKLRRRMG
jgi:hypothetical protein